MRSEEPPEDRKLSTVKSWFTRSLSSISSQNGSVDAASDGNSSSVSVSKEGMLESGPGFTPLRQLSMRRSRPSGEIGKEPGTGSPSMTPRNITPLTPLTPLRWKSNPREQEEEEKAMERSRFGMPRDDEGGRGKLAADNGKEDRAAEVQQQDTLVAGAAVHDRTKSVGEISTKAQADNVDTIGSPEPAEGIDRKPSSGDDVMTMTIEFLRARLLSERSASKTAKLRVQQLATKVSELEQKLDQAIADRKQVEIASQEAFMKLKLAENSKQVLDRASGEVSDRSMSNSRKGSPLSRSTAGREDMKYLQPEMSSNEDLSRTNSYGSSVEDRDSTTKKLLPETVIKIEGRIAEQDRPGMMPTLQNMAERSMDSPQKSDSRAAIESRLRNMWSKISEEMASLAEERSEEDVVREELMSWMGQVPSVLQDIIPKKLVSPTHDVPSSLETESTEQKFTEVCPEPSPRSLPEKGEQNGSAKRAVLLHDQFATQENIQQEWEKNYEESQRKLDQFKGDDRNANRSPRASPGYRERQHMDHMHGLNGVTDDSAFFGSHHARLAKSKSSLDLPIRPHECNLDISSSHRDGLNAESDVQNRERSRDLVYQNIRAQRPIPLEPIHLNHSRMHQQRSAPPSMLQDAGNEAWPDRQLDQEAGLYYQETGNHAGHPSNAERGPSDRSQWPPTNISVEDGFRRSQPDFRVGQPTWDDGDRRSSGRHLQAQPGYGDANGPMESESYDRDGEREESNTSSHPESTGTHQYRHRHRRSHSDNGDWPAVEDYGLLNQPLEPSPGLGRRQSYSGHPAASDSSRSGFDKSSGPYGDPRFSDERMHGARGQRRESFPISKKQADHAFGQQHSTQAGNHGFSNGEPPLSLGYGPAFDAPRDGSPLQSSPKAGVNKNVSDVLRALQMAKANIKNGAGGAKESRVSGDQASLKTGHRMEPSAQYMPAPRQTMPEQFRYAESQAPFFKSSRPPSHGARYNPYEADYGSDRYQSEGEGNANPSYVDQLNVGKGIQFFFP